MALLADEPGKGSSIEAYGTGSYFTGCDTSKVTRIVQLPEDTTWRFIDALGARDPDGQVNPERLYAGIEPIGRRVGLVLRETLFGGGSPPLCRKPSSDRCGVSVELGFSSIVFAPDEGSLEPFIPTHVSCGDAYIRASNTNVARTAPVPVERGPTVMRFDVGCFAQMQQAAEVAGQLMIAELQQLEQAGQQ